MGLTIAGMTWPSGTYCMQVPGMTYDEPCRHEVCNRHL